MPTPADNPVPIEPVRPIKPPRGRASATASEAPPEREWRWEIETRPNEEGHWPRKWISMGYLVTEIPDRPDPYRIAIYIRYGTTKEAAKDKVRGAIDAFEWYADRENRLKNQTETVQYRRHGRLGSP